MPTVGDLEQHELTRRDQEIAIQRLSDVERKTLAKRVELTGRHRVEARQLD